jgi:hypothetical protein
MTATPNPWDRTHAITITVDEAVLTSVNDETLAFWWHLAQHNPADGFAASEPGELAMKIGWEIIRRWLRKAPVELYHHQQQHYYWNQLRKLGYWREGREFVPHIMPPDTRIVRDALTEAAEHQKIFDPRKAAEYEQALTALDAAEKPENGTDAPDSAMRED